MSGRIGKCTKPGYFPLWIGKSSCKQISVHFDEGILESRQLNDFGIYGLERCAMFGWGQAWSLFDAITSPWPTCGHVLPKIVSMPLTTALSNTQQIFSVLLNNLLGAYWAWSKFKRFWKYESRHNLSLKESQSSVTPNIPEVCSRELASELRYFKGVIMNSTGCSDDRHTTKELPFLFSFMQC